VADSGDAPGAKAAGPQRRYLTMLFSDLTDSTRIASTMETEDYAELLSHLRGFYTDVIPRHGGTLVQIQGDGVLAIFGYPEAREENGRQATEAALDLHDLVRALGTRPEFAHLRLSLHTGVHAGLVLFEAGDSVRGRFELLGNATNLASRLSDVAEADELLVSEETLGPELAFFQTSERRPLMLKGRVEPLSTYRILARAAAGSRYETRARRGLVPFVGRHAELGILERNLKEAMAGEHRYVALSGPAGLGKTRLAEEFLNRAAQFGCQVHRGYCESYPSAEPLQPFLQVLRSYCGLDREMSAALAAEALDAALSGLDPSLLPDRQDLLRALSISVPGAGDEVRRSSPERTLAALRDLVAALAASRPLVLFIDDWQWSDDVSRQVLRAIWGLAGRPIFVLISTRGFAAGDAGMSDALILDLAPFNAEEAAATIARLLPATSPFEIGEISRYAGGNPLFLEELCHSAAHERPSRPRGARTGVAWLNTLIESRVARLPLAQIELVRTAAVIGNVIPVWLLESLTGCGERHPFVRGLAEQDFIFPAEHADALRFKHGIARDVIYNSVGLRERKALHLRVAELLQREGARGGQEELYEQLAYHFAASGNAAEAARYAELAGDKATAVSALDRAQTQYRAALVALDLLGASDEIYRRWIQIAQRLGMTCVFDPARDHLDIFRRAVDLATAHDDPDAIAHAQYWLGYINYGLGDSGVAIHHLERSLTSAAQFEEPRLILKIRATLGQAYAAACDYDKALALLDEAVAAKRQRDKGGRTAAVGYAYTLACRAAVLGDRGLFADAYACFDEALDSVSGSGHEVEGSILCWRSGVYLWQGRWEDARDAAAAAQRVAERVKSLYLYAMSQSLGAYASWCLAPGPAALQTISEATSWLETRDRGLFISLNYGWLAEGLVASGRVEEARRNAARALIRSHKQDRIGEAMACRAMARSAARGDQHKPPGHYIERAMAAARARGSPHELAVTQLCHAGIELAGDNRAMAAPLLDRAEDAFRSMGMAWHVAEAARLRTGY